MSRKFNEAAYTEHMRKWLDERREDLADPLGVPAKDAARDLRDAMVKKLSPIVRDPVAFALNITSLDPPAQRASIVRQLTLLNMLKIAEEHRASFGDFEAKELSWRQDVALRWQRIHAQMRKLSESIQSMVRKIHPATRPDRIPRMLTHTIWALFLISAITFAFITIHRRAAHDGSLRLACHVSIALKHTLLTTAKREHRSDPIDFLSRGWVPTQCTAIASQTSH